MTRLSNLTGQKFGRLTVIDRAENNKWNRSQWNCRCDCGVEKVVGGADLVHGNTKSCGCLRVNICSVDGCNRRCFGNGMCQMHYQRIRRTGQISTKRRPAGSGGLSHGGYVRISVNGKRVYEHIHVAERALGKPLPKGAVVHHVNEIRTDNRPENLVICPSVGYHQMLHRRMEEIGK